MLRAVQLASVSFNGYLDTLEWSVWLWTDLISFNSQSRGCHSTHCYHQYVHSCWINSWRNLGDDIIATLSIQYHLKSLVRQWFQVTTSLTVTEIRQIHFTKYKDWETNLEMADTSTTTNAGHIVSLKRGESIFNTKDHTKQQQYSIFHMSHVIIRVSSPSLLAHSQLSIPILTNHGRSLIVMNISKIISLPVLNMDIATVVLLKNLVEVIGLSTHH